MKYPITSCFPAMTASTRVHLCIPRGSSVQCVLEERLVNEFNSLHTSVQLILSDSDLFFLPNLSFFPLQWNIFGVFLGQEEVKMLPQTRRLLRRASRGTACGLMESGPREQIPDPWTADGAAQG